MFDAEPMPRPIPFPAGRATTRPLFERLHEWVATVDHKRLGIMYILYALTFLLIGGVEATIMRIQLIVPHNDFVSPQVFNRMFTMHGTTMIFFVAMPILFGFINYMLPLMIGARDMAFPRLNAWGFWMTAFGGLILYFSFFGGSGLYGTADLSGVFARAQHRLLDHRVARERLRQHRHRDQYRDHDTMHALSGDDLGQDASFRLAQSGDGRPRHPCPGPTRRSSDHVVDRSLFGRPLL